MNHKMTKYEVASELQCSLEDVYRLIEDGCLTGANDGEEWHTTWSIFVRDLEIMAEEERIAQLRSGEFAPLNDGLRDIDLSIDPVLIESTIRLLKSNKANSRQS
jgi:hypothetical protein